MWFLILITTGLGLAEVSGYPSRINEVADFGNGTKPGSRLKREFLDYVDLNDEALIISKPNILPKCNPEKYPCIRDYPDFGEMPTETLAPKRSRSVGKTGKRRPFLSWGGKRDNFGYEGKRKFNSWGGKRSPYLQI